MFWLWFGVWFVLVVLAAGVFAILIRSLWVKAVRLLRELDEAGVRMGELQAQVSELATAQQTRREELAVFGDPNRMRAVRLRERKLHERARARAKLRAARTLSATGERRVGRAT